LLCDLIFGLPFNFLGLNGVVLSAALAIALSFTWSYQMARLRGSSMAVTLMLLVLSIETCSIHWSARPHVFTYLLFLACYYECFIAQSSLKWRASKLAIIMAVWGNMHGSYPLGVAMIICRAGGDFLQHSAESRSSGSLSATAGRDNSATAFGASAASAESNTSAGSTATEIKSAAASNTPESVTAPESSSASSCSNWKVKDSIITLAVAILASCLNLRGPAFIQYILSYLSSSKIRANSDEWRSLDFIFGAPAWSFIALMLFLFCMWVYAKTKPRLGEFAYVLFLLCSSIYAMRLIPYFALAALPAMAVQAGELSTSRLLLHTPFLGKFLAADQRASSSEFKLSKSFPLWICLAAAMSAVFLFAPALRINDFDPAQMPVRASDYMKANAISGLGFAKDNWGAYLYWKLKVPIFIDDKTDFYSQDLLSDYTKIFMTTPGWQKSFAKYPFSYLLIPPGLPLQYLLTDQVPGWKESYSSSDAVLFTK